MVGVGVASHISSHLPHAGPWGPKTPLRRKATPMTSLAAVAPGLPSLAPFSGFAPSLVPLPPLRLPITQPPYLLSQRLALRDERGHLPAVATAAFGHGVLAAWAARARAPGMIGVSAEGCGAAPEGVRSARRPRRECAELV